MAQKTKVNAFTLIEMMTVVVIIAILVSLPLMRYLRLAENSRASEAVTNLSAVRQSLLRYYSPKQNFTGATLNSLDIDDPNATTQRLFTYSLTIPTATTFTVLATRNTIDGGDTGSTVGINQDGTKWGTGYFSGVK